MRLTPYEKCKGVVPGQFCGTMLLRCRAPVARQAHNLEVGGSIPPGAISFDKERPGPFQKRRGRALLFLGSRHGTGVFGGREDEWRGEGASPAEAGENPAVGLAGVSDVGRGVDRLAGELGSHAGGKPGPAGGQRDEPADGPGDPPRVCAGGVAVKNRDGAGVSGRVGYRCRSVSAAPETAGGCGASCLHCADAFRFTPMESHREEAVARAGEAVTTQPEVTGWVISGHSLGGVLACRLVRSGGPRLARDSCRWARRIRKRKAWRGLDDPGHEGLRQEGRDRVGGLGGGEPEPAPRANEVGEDRGGNHPQFVHSGHQLFDGRATIGRERQQGRTREALLDALERAGG